MNVPRLYGTVYLTEAGARRWPELDLREGDAATLLGCPDEHGQAAQIPFHPLYLLLTDGDYTLSAPAPAADLMAPLRESIAEAKRRRVDATPTPAALRNPRAVAPPVHTEEVTACRTDPTGTDAPAPLTPDAVPGWPGLTDDEISAFRWVTF